MWEYSPSLAAVSLAVPPLIAGLVPQAEAQGKGDAVTIAPLFYPLDHFKPDIDLSGKLAVITGRHRVATVALSPKPSRRWASM
jgi:hypothetical protein